MENKIEIENCCFICSNISFHTDGIYCGLTQYMVDYADCCDDFIIDEQAKNEMMINIKNKQIEDQLWENLSDFEKFLVKHTAIGKMMYLNSIENEEKKDDQD